MASLSEKSNVIEPNGASSTNSPIFDRVRSLTFTKAAERNSRRFTATGRRRLIIALCVAIVLLVFGIQSLTGRLFSPGVAELDVVTVQSEYSAAVVLDTSGYLMARRKVQVLPKIPGTILELTID